MIKSISPSDYTVRPFRVHKTWTLTSSSDGVVVDEGVRTTGTFTSESEATNSVSGNYKRSVYDQIHHMYYVPSRSLLELFGGGLNASETTRSIHDRVSVLSVPVRYFGTSIRPNSVTITSSSVVLKDDGYGNLYDEATSSEHVGNVFYSHGIITCTHTGSEYSSSFSNAFEIEFQSTMTIYEHEVLCTVNENEFNFSTNPTATTGSMFLQYFHEYDYSSSIDPTGSYLAPYITTIGLYDDGLNMVAVAKLAKPVKSIPDFPINFIVRFDS